MSNIFSEFIFSDMYRIDLYKNVGISATNLTLRKKVIEREFKKQKNISLEYHDYKIKNRGKYKTFYIMSKSQS